MDIFAEVTDRIIHELEKGIIPWEKPWTGTRSGAFSRVTGKPYSLLNQMLLGKPGEYVTFEVSRLSRSTKQLCELIDLVRQKRLRLVIMGSITVDCRNGEIDPMTKAFLQMAGVFAEVELAMIRARVRSGLQNAVSKGRKLGRRPLAKEDIPAAFYKHFPLYRSGNLNVSELARVCGCSRPTVYHYLVLINEFG